MRKLLRGLGIGLTLVLWTLLLVVVIGGVALVSTGIPHNGAGMTAKTVCSSVFVGGRDVPTQDLLDSDVIAADPLLGVVSATVDTEQRTVTGRFLGVVSRQAAFLGERGCVLDAEADPSTVPYVARGTRAGAWPEGDQATAVPPAEADMAALEAVIDGAFADAGDPAGQNTRGIAVVKDGELIASRESPVLPPGAALHGWSMTKTIASMLAVKRFDEVGLDIETPVVDAFPAGREPEWVADWRADERAGIAVADLLFMRAGLELDESYAATGDVVQMLYGQPDMAAFGAAAPAEYPAGTYWEYLSPVSNILAEVVRAQFATDAEYWAYPRAVLFEPLGLHAGALETDTSGTWVASSYQWGTTTDWARLGQLMLDGGRWQGEQILPESWATLATTPAVPDGEGHGYGAQTYMLADPVGGECREYPGVPAGTLAMEGHWGQVVAAIPSLDAVIVRLGWTFDGDQFDGCQFISDVAATLAVQPAA
jgi:CubicO group peptidase (beta-lactamase class C family)